MPTTSASAVTDHEHFIRWLEDYERAWRSPGTDGLAALFGAGAQYLRSPYEAPLTGLGAIAAWWDTARDGPDEPFTMTTEVVSVSGDTGVARVLVRYGEPVTQEYTDLWVVRFEASGRAARFEEWPYWPGKPYTVDQQTPPVVVGAVEVVTERWAEWVRSGALSSGVYRLPAGGADAQTPHEQDEVYVVLRGAATLVVEDTSHPVRAGSLAFVPATMAHRFVDITDDLEVAVVFAPPESAD